MEKSLETQITELTVALKTATDEVKSQAEKSQTEIKNLGGMTAETKESADKALLAMNTLDTRLKDIEQKMSRQREQDGAEFKSLGYQVIESDEMKAAMAQGANFRGRVNVEVKNITSASTSGTSATTGLVVADRQGYLALPNRQLVVRDLLMPGRTASGSIEYPKELVFTNSAATVAENPGSAKPQSDITWSLVNTPVRTIAHWVKASRQIMMDAPQLQSIIDGRLRYGLGYAEDLQLLLGDGTGTNINGLMTQATAYSAATTGLAETASVTRIDRLRLALLQATLALLPSDGMVLNPVDWAAIELTKDTQNRYIFANPTSTIGAVLWGKPVVQSLAMTVNLFLAGAFKTAAQIFDREDANVLVSTEDQDNFVKNMVTVLAEERLALAVYRPQAFIKGNFTGVA